MLRRPLKGIANQGIGPVIRKSSVHTFRDFGVSAATGGADTGAL